MAGTARYTLGDKQEQISHDVKVCLQEVYKKLKRHHLQIGWCRCFVHSSSQKLSAMTLTAAHLFKQLLLAGVKMRGQCHIVSEDEVGAAVSLATKTYLGPLLCTWLHFQT